MPGLQYDSDRRSNTILSRQVAVHAFRNSTKGELRAEAEEDFHVNFSSIPVRTSRHVSNEKRAMKKSNTALNQHRQPSAVSWPSGVRISQESNIKMFKKIIFTCRVVLEKDLVIFGKDFFSCPEILFQASFYHRLSAAALSCCLQLSRCSPGVELLSEATHKTKKPPAAEAQAPVLD